MNVSQNFQYFPLLMWGHIRCMHARPHRRKDQLPLRSLRMPWKSFRRWSFAKEPTHFEHIRRKVNPTAIGRIPPSFFRRPISLVSKKKKGLKPTGTLPSKTKFSTLVSFCSNSLPMGSLLSRHGLCTTGAKVGLVLPKTQRGRS